MPSCRTCKNWRPDDYRAIEWSRSGVSWGLCTALTSADDTAGVAPARIAEAACYGEGIGGDFLSRPEFFCALHESG